ncbi:hypothetical protein NL506_27830, partial [Klebsiella pneumoniae]|nr:hypothetical protein [Klebsiella pneumoniae]
GSLTPAALASAALDSGLMFAVPGPAAKEQMVTAVPPDVPSAFNMYGGVKPVTSTVKEPSVAEEVVFSTAGDEESLS